MMRTSCAVAALLMMVAMQSGHALAQEVQWHAATTFEVEGKGWADTAEPFDRLPDAVKAKVTPAVWGLSKHSAGIAIRFATDVNTVNARWSVTSDSLAMPHMPATGVSGVDLYVRTASGDWRFVGNGRPHKKEGNVATFRLPGNDKALHECLLYLPLYNGTKSLEIGVAEGARLEKAAPRPAELQKPVVVYGTSIAHGGCASRPGLAWPTILGRWLDRPVINLGFSGSGKMEPPVGEVLAEIDASAFVIDCIWNMGDLSQDEYTKRVTELVQAIRKAHPQTPIVFVGQSHIDVAKHPTDFTRRQEAAVESLKKSGVEGLVLVPGRDLLGDDGEGTVDGVHPNDLGMDRQARALLPVMRDVLKDAKR